MFEEITICGLFARHPIYAPTRNCGLSAVCRAWQFPARTGRNDCAAGIWAAEGIKHRWVNGRTAKVRSIQIRVALDERVVQVRRPLRLAGAAGTSRTIGRSGRRWLANIAFGPTEEKSAYRSVGTAGRCTKQRDHGAGKNQLFHFKTPRQEGFGG